VYIADVFDRDPFSRTAARLAYAQATPTGFRDRTPAPRSPLVRAASAANLRSTARPGSPIRLWWSAMTSRAPRGTRINPHSPGAASLNSFFRTSPGTPGRLCGSPCLGHVRKKPMRYARCSCHGAWRTGRARPGGPRWRSLLPASGRVWLEVGEHLDGPG